jgi:hypothetical protein
MTCTTCFPPLRRLWTASTAAVGQGSVPAPGRWEYCPIGQAPAGGGPRGPPRLEGSAWRTLSRSGFTCNQRTRFVCSSPKVPTEVAAAPVRLGRLFTPGFCRECDRENTRKGKKLAGRAYRGSRTLQVGGIADNLAYSPGGGTGIFVPSIVAFTQGAITGRTFKSGGHRFRPQQSASQELYQITWLGEV